MTVRPSPLRVSTSVAILSFDWAVYAITITHFRDWAYATVFGALGAALTVALLEQRSGASHSQLMLRGAVAGAVVVIPLPLLGTAVALAFLIWSVVAHAQSQRAH